MFSELIAFIVLPSGHFQFEPGILILSFDARIGSLHFH